MGKKAVKIILLFAFFLVLVFSVAFGLYIFRVYRITKANLKTQAGQIQLSGPKYEINTKDDYWFGSTNPKVTIIEFSDFACPNSRNSFPSIRELVTKYNKDVKLIFKDYPQFDESLDLANGARCAGEQGLFWLMHDKLFLNQGINSAAGIIEAAREIGADTGRFQTCFDNAKYQDLIKNDALEGQRISLSGTPTWIINGYMVYGDIPLPIWEKLINQLIK